MMNAVSMSADSRATIRVSRPSTRQTPTTISSTGSRCPTEPARRLREQPVGADRADVLRRVGKLEHPGDQPDTADDEPRDQPTASARLAHEVTVGRAAESN